MKALLSIFFVLATAASFAQNGAAGQSKEPFSILITTENSTVKTNGDVEIKIRLTNTSEHPINASYHIYLGINAGYEYEIRDANGNVLPRKERKGGLEGSFRLRTLNPGESMQNSVTLNRIYDLSAPGEYVIQVSRNIADDDDKDGVVRSNKIAVTVVP